MPKYMREVNPNITDDEMMPATLCPEIMTGLLRDKLGFKGLVVTDSLTMKAVFDNYSLEEIVYYGMTAGNDILLLCGARRIDEQKESNKNGMSIIT